MQTCGVKGCDASIHKRSEILQGSLACSPVAVPFSPAGCVRFATACLNTSKQTSKEWKFLPITQLPARWGQILPMASRKLPAPLDDLGQASMVVLPGPREWLTRVSGIPIPCI